MVSSILAKVAKLFWKVLKKGGGRTPYKERKKEKHMAEGWCCFHIAFSQGLTKQLQVTTFYNCLKLVNEGQFTIWNI